MGEIIRVADKIPEPKNQKSVHHVRKSNDSISRNSTIEHVLFLQRTLGNQAVQRLMKSGVLHAKLRIGMPGDIYEQEADRVAEQVMRIHELPVPKGAAVSGQIIDNPIQRRCPRCIKDSGSQFQKKKETLQTKEGQGQTPETTPEIANIINAIRGGGQPLPESVRAFYEPRFGHDFSQVRVHTDVKAAEAARAVNAKAYTTGKDVVFGAGQYAPGTSVGRHLLAHELTHVMQQKGVKAVTGAVQRAPLPEATPAVKEVSAAEMTDEELAADIMDMQLAILEGWDTALANFDKVLTSASDAESKPDFKKVIKKFLEDKLMGELIKRSKVPGASDAFALLGKLEDEVKRASAATESATLRDFFVQHKTAIGSLKQTTLALKEKFVAKVRKTRERMEIAENIGQARRRGRRGAGEVTIALSNEASEYGMMRMTLVETSEQMDSLLKISTPKDLFLKLSEEWIRQAKTTGAWGYKYPANVIIRLKKDYTIIDAHIEGSGGQKIAEQLLKDSPNGVDVFSLKVRRRIVVYADNGWPSAFLSLDENNRNINVGSYIEGDWGPVQRFVMAHGLPPTKKLTGD